MKLKILRAMLALILTLAAGGAGYAAADPKSESIPAQTVSAVTEGLVRVIYSLDQKQNDKEIIALIDSAEEYIYFAIYTFTLPSIADALIEAKKRGVEVKGITDSKQSVNSYSAPVTEKLLSANIPLLTETDDEGDGIMHIKLLVTERAYAFGSYNWTSSATTINDEILEIGTDPALRQAHETILRGLFKKYAGTSVRAAVPVSIGTIAHTEAPKYIGEYASVQGTLLRAYTSKSGTVFLDFCENYKSCPFTGVIFADDADKFGDLTRYQGKTITLIGKIVLYNGKAEIILSSANQLTSP
jgi:hypothetical protein